MIENGPNLKIGATAAIFVLHSRWIAWIFVACSLLSPNSFQPDGNGPTDSPSPWEDTLPATSAKPRNVMPANA